MEVVCGFPTNKRSVKNANPMPMMNYILDQLRKAKYMNRLARGPVRQNRKVGARTATVRFRNFV